MWEIRVIRNLAILSMSMAICMAILLAGINIVIIIRERHRCGQWISVTTILACIYLVGLYASRLLGLGRYNPLGLIEGVLSVYLLELSLIWYSVFELVSHGRRG